MKTKEIKLEYTIKANKETIMPLICPVKEYDWIKDWKCKLIHCPNEKNETGVVFKEKFSAPFILGRSNGYTRWETINFDIEKGVVRFKLTNSKLHIDYLFRIKENEAKHSLLELQFVIKPINGKGEKLLNEKGMRKLTFMISGLAKMLVHYAETGTMYNSAGSKRVNEFLKTLSLPEKLILIHNKIHMKLMKDKTRIKYLNR